MEMSTMRAQASCQDWDEGRDGLRIHAHTHAHAHTHTHTHTLQYLLDCLPRTVTRAYPLPGDGMNESCGRFLSTHTEQIQGASPQAAVCPVPSLLLLFRAPPYPWLWGPQGSLASISLPVRISPGGWGGTQGPRSTTSFIAILGGSRAADFIAMSHKR